MLSKAPRGLPRSASEQPSTQMNGPAAGEFRADLFTSLFLNSSPTGVNSTGVNVIFASVSKAHKLLYVYTLVIFCQGDLCSDDH